MGKWLLKFVHLFDRVFIRQGVDLNHMYTIVETKMMMDKRRVYMNWRQQLQSENSDHLLMVLGGYFLFGAVIALIIFFVPSMATAMILMHAYIIFMMSMTLIIDFSNILLDTADNQIILPKPVGGRTLFMARQVHIVLYLLQFAIALCILPLIVAGIKYGLLTGIASIVTMTFSVVLAMSVTYILYLLLLRFSSEARIKEMVTWLQIIMTVFFTVGYQFVMRFTAVAEMTKDIHLHWYAYLLPPVWMASALEAVFTRSFNMHQAIMIALALCVPLILLWILNKYLSPVFTARLSALHTDAQPGVVSVNRRNQKKSISGILSAWLEKTPVSRAIFEMVWKITGKEKTFKLQFYPMFGYTVVFLVFFVLFGGKQNAASISELSASSKYLWFIYFPMFMIASAFLSVSFSENYAASWVYYAAPVKKPGCMLMATLNALFVKYFLPLYIIFFGICLYIWKLPVVDDFLFGLTNNYLCLLTGVIIVDKYLPFSRPPSTREQSGRGILMMLLMIIIAVMVGIHYLISKIPGALYVFFPVEIFLCWLIRRELRNLPWKKISV
jgi:hypothetical protein